jgi:hypothetical protein
MGVTPPDMAGLFKAQVNDASLSYLAPELQRVFNGLAETVNSKEYQEFKGLCADKLKGLKGQTFIFDLEGVVLSDIETYKLWPNKIYHLLPWMLPVLEALTNHGNRLIFWTSAPKESIPSMQSVMPPELAAYPTIDQDDFRIWLDQNGENTLPPGEWDQYLSDKTQYLRSHKLPSLYPLVKGDPNNSVFIDDNQIFVDSAVAAGWPKERAIRLKSAQDLDVLELVDRILTIPQFPQHP